MLERLLTKSWESPAAVDSGNYPTVKEVVVKRKLDPGVSQNEDLLVKAGREGNAEALELLFSRYSRTLYPTALRLMGNAEDAEDALQEGLLSAFRNLKRFEGRSQFSTWMTRIVINAALMRLRHNRTHPVVSLDANPPNAEDSSLGDMIPDGSLNPEEACVQGEMQELLEKNVRALPNKLQRAVWLRDMEDLSTQEAAETLAIGPATMKSQLHRARTKLSGMLKNALQGRDRKTGMKFPGPGMEPQPADS